MKFFLEGVGNIDTGKLKVNRGDGATVLFKESKSGVGGPVFVAKFNNKFIKEAAKKTAAKAKKKKK